MELQKESENNHHSKTDFETWASLHRLSKRAILECLHNCEKSFCWANVSSDSDPKVTLTHSDCLVIAQNIHKSTFRKSQVEINEFNRVLQITVTPSTVRERSYSKVIAKHNRPTRFRIVFKTFDEPADALNLVHEYFHCVQFYESQCTEIPPMLRELAAFIGELFFLQYIASHIKSKYAPLFIAWRKSNRIYVLKYAARLALAATSRARYSYEWNYPIARILSVAIVDMFPREKLAAALSSPSCLTEVVVEAIELLSELNWSAKHPSLDYEVDRMTSVNSNEYIGISVLQLLRENGTNRAKIQSIHKVFNLVSRKFSRDDYGLVTDYLLRPYVKNRTIN